MIKNIGAFRKKLTLGVAAVMFALSVWFGGAQSDNQVAQVDNVPVVVVADGGTGSNPSGGGG